MKMTPYKITLRRNFMELLLIWHILTQKQFICVKSVQIQSFPWPVFSRIQPKYEKIRTKKNSVFSHFSCTVWVNICFELFKG